MASAYSEDNTSMYIIVNSDLGMSKGKIASQVGHAVEKITMKIFNASLHKTDSYFVEYQKYLKNGHRKIVLVAPLKEIEKFKDDKDAVYIIDEGLTEIPHGSLTVIAFLPSNSNKERFKKYRLL
jgi:peptidyl-tRNA hydrolase